MGERRDVGPVRPVDQLDWNALEQYLLSVFADLCGPMRVLQFANGSANLTYLVELAGRRFVIRRPPFGKLAPGAHDMRREYGALSRLWKSYPPAPRAYHLCGDSSVIGSEFVVLEYRDGVVIWDTIPESMRGHENVGERVGSATIDALAALHRVDVERAGLADLGRPEGFLERQVTGWAKRWALVSSGETELLMSQIGSRLAQTLPMSQRPSVLHNDFKVDNCQFDPARPDEVKSVFDWDMATVGDPLVDLGTTLSYWPDGPDPAGSVVLRGGMERIGLPGHCDVIERYELRTGLDVDGIHWYEAFATWKLAVVLQQLFVRWQRGESTDDRLARYGAKVTAQARRAASILHST